MDPIGGRERSKGQKTFTVRFPVMLLAIAVITATTAPTLGCADCAKFIELEIQEWPSDIYNLVPWIADSDGLFRKHCLGVKFVPLVGGPPAISALVSGALGFVNQAPDVNVRSGSKGADVRMTSNMHVGAGAL